MQSGDVRTVRDMIFLRYARAAARNVFNIPDIIGTEKDQPGYVDRVYNDLKTGRWRWSDVPDIGPDAVQREGKCAFCGARNARQQVCMVPNTIRVNEGCPQCDRVQEPGNQVSCCESCKTAKANKGLYAFFRDLFPGETRFCDFIPAHVEKNYLKIVYCCHDCAETLDGEDLDGDGELTVMDIDEVVARHVG